MELIPDISRLKQFNEYLTGYSFVFKTGYYFTELFD